jgi:hypothetical protein
MHQNKKIKYKGAVSLNRIINRAASWNDILSMAVENAEEIDAVNVSTSLHRIAKMRPGSVDLQVMLARKQAAKIPLRVLAVLNEVKTHTALAPTRIQPRHCHLVSVRQVRRET